MAKRSVKWTRTADIQYVGIIEYWVKRNKSNFYSLKLIDIVSKATHQIALNPHQYKKTSYKNVHVSILGSYSIYFKITSDVIIIMAFWDN